MPSLPGLARQVLGRKIQTRYQLVEQAGFTHTGMAADQTGFPPNKSFQRLQAFRLTGGNRKKSRGGKGIDLLPSFQLFFIPGSEQVHFVDHQYWRNMIGFGRDQKPVYKAQGSSGTVQGSQKQGQV